MYNINTHKFNVPKCPLINKLQRDKAPTISPNGKGIDIDYGHHQRLTDHRLFSNRRQRV